MKHRQNWYLRSKEDCPIKAKNDMLEVKKADYLSGYKIEVLFNTGEKKVVDLAKALNGIFFQPLRDVNFFRSFKINFNTIEWGNGADFAPEFLYEIGE
jgi:hypothetical protein